MMSSKKAANPHTDSTQMNAINTLPTTNNNQPAAMADCKVVHAMACTLIGESGQVLDLQSAAANDADTSVSATTSESGEVDPIDFDAGSPHVAAERPTSLSGMDLHERWTARASAALRQVIAERLNHGRALAGLSQVEMANAIGLKNSTQLCLWERAQRMPPLHALLSAADVLGVSIDFLVGVSDEPDRDPQVARRTALLGAMRQMLEQHAAAAADVILAAEIDPTKAIRAHALCGKTAELARAVEQFRQKNSDTFDELPMGALLLRLARDAAEAAQQVATFLDEAEDRRYRALASARRVVF